MTSKKIQALDNQEMWVLTPAEQARLVALAGRAGVKIVRGKSPEKLGGRMDQVWADARARILAEEKAAEDAKQKKADEKAKAKAARGSMWW
ncbi:hypothetical protein AB0G79_33095 [Streptomyces sp. NPDC020807]|uniref:hypothetical protein n=1 Tax=Streptomyces sp. NPDC020807 TaxID=3155119 RepID=UPI0033F2E229